jgi:small subunit ribosomal protein S7
MSRSKTITKKPGIPDPIYNSRLVQKLINKSMYDGKKSTAAAQIYGALDILKQKNADADPSKILETVLTTVAPKMEVRSRRVGGASYQVPSEVRGERKNHLAMKWLIEAARGKSNKEFHTFAEKLASEMQDALAGTGNAIKKRDMVHKMAEANRAFAHLRW